VLQCAVLIVYYHPFALFCQARDCFKCWPIIMRMLLGPSWAFALQPLHCHLANVLVSGLTDVLLIRFLLANNASWVGSLYRTGC
jgi:hypothetical protein